MDDLYFFNHENEMKNAHENYNFHTPKNLLDAIEQVVRSCRNSQLSDQYLQDASIPLQYIGDKLQLTPTQSALLSLVLEGGRDRGTSISDMCRILNCPTVHLYTKMEDLSELIKRKFIHKHKSFVNGEPDYLVSLDALHAIIHDAPFVPKDISFDSWEDFIDYVTKLYDQLDDEDLDKSTFNDELRDVFDANKKLDLVKKIIQYTKDLTLADFQIFMFAIVHFISRGDEGFTAGHVNFLFEENQNRRRILSALGNDSSPLIRDNLLEIASNEGLFYHNTYRISKHIRKDLFPFLAQTDKFSDIKEIVKSENIVERELFFNEAEKKQVSRLYEILDADHFQDIQRRLKDKGRRSGVCCLLYGMPGTGKTELVHQLARTTGRDIYQVNMSQLRSKWVGESEKLVQNMFSEYDSCVRNSSKAPILLVNEADGLLTTRMKGASRSADKSENTIQNIILQNMENLNGIMIATTNIAENLDPASERRFLFKVKFDKPCISVRKSIWMSMIPELTEQDAETLAQGFNFSGGQIENIARKADIENILTGAPLNINSLIQYCREETIVSENTTIVGFAS